MPRSRSLRCWILAGLSVTLGCHRSPAPPVAAQPRPAKVAPKAAAPATAGVEPKAADLRLTAAEAKQICLAEPGGGSALDKELSKNQGLARRLGLKPETWIQAGWSWVRKARLAADPGFYVNVEACAETALHVQPGQRSALQLRGLVLMNGHRFAEARDLAQEILLKEPEDVIALATLSDALLELGRFEDAVSAAQRMADARPDPASYVRASYFRWLTGDRGGAKTYIRSALVGRDARDPEPAAWTFVEAAKIFWNEADYRGADAVLAEALKWVPDYPPALVARGRVALSLEQPQRAVEYLEKAYRAQPLPETAWLLGDAREMLGDTRGAEAEFDRVVRMGKRSDRLTLALFYATKDRAHEDAVRLLEEERASRGGVYVDDAYAWALYRAGRIADARRASDHAVRLGTPDARLLYHAGAIRIAAGDTTGRALVEKALALNPRFDHTGAAEARQLLADGARTQVAAAGPPGLSLRAR